MPESSAAELKKFDFSKFIVKFQKIISLVFTVIMIDLEGAGIKRPPYGSGCIWEGTAGRGNGQKVHLRSPKKYHVWFLMIYKVSDVNKELFSDLNQYFGVYFTFLDLHRN